MISDHLCKHNSTPAGFLASADDTAPLVAFLRGEPSRFVVGQNNSIV
ncbi:MAG: hypothetical protein AAGA34_05890 [Pseudomonadota bacterium]